MSQDGSSRGFSIKIGRLLRHGVRYDRLPVNSVADFSLVYRVVGRVVGFFLGDVDHVVRRRGPAATVGTFRPVRVVTRLLQ